ncbi:cyclodeaminase/cyclohydrolase family protein [Desulfotruncus alcoholivorax]|uniref:cyclodeaminase/cyclohydrolase family protein n=1 Tax=Desulfotruncus alcoholivorax TaxID=265477 RepID=UPI000410249C|nr:cyclodeaminase/cyclohydrolase family protein [Desulfotruncus alcoholivorax]
MLMEMTVKGFLDELASKSPAPGGGSVSALAGSLAAALVSMVARLTGAEAGNENMRRILEQAGGLMERLSRHVDDDAAAFNLVMQAYRLPKQTEVEKEQRSAAIQEALKGAASHPLLVAGECLQVLALCLEVVTLGNPNALSDAGVASLMAYSGITGAMFNVAINLEGIKDPVFTQQSMAERDRIMSEAGRLYAGIQALMQKKLACMVEW